MPLVLGMQITNPVAQLGSMVPGVARTYDASVTALLTSTAANAQLTVADVDSGTGRLANGTTELASAIQVRATNTANPNTAYAPVPEDGSRLRLLTFPAPFSAAPLTIWFKQSINATEPLLIGGYGKTLVFTLSATTP